MKTFSQWLGTCHNPNFDQELSKYMKYALGEMEKQLHLLLDMRPYGQQIDEAYDKGYQAAQKAKAYDSGYAAGEKTKVYDCDRSVDIDRLKRENKAARECAITYCKDNSIAYAALTKLRHALDISRKDINAADKQ